MDTWINIIKRWILPQRNLQIQVFSNKITGTYSELFQTDLEFLRKYETPKLGPTTLKKGKVGEFTQSDFQWCC